MAIYIYTPISNIPVLYFCVWDKILPFRSSAFFKIFFLAPLLGETNWEPVYIQALWVYQDDSTEHLGDLELV